MTTLQPSSPALLQPSRAPSSHTGSLLLVDDEPDNLDLLEGMLARSNYRMTRCDSGVAALAMLRAHPDDFDAVLLDRMMPELDGISVLREMKAHADLQRIPVILQTAAGNSVQVAEGLAAGAHYYLVKPFDRAQLLPIVQGAVNTFQVMRDMRRRLLEANPLGLIENGRFRYRTLMEARELAAWLSRASGDPSPIAFGLQELMINAVEHGSLEIGYERKRAALMAGTLEQEVQSRLEDPRFAGRSVTVDVIRTDAEVVYTITDEGPGFDHAHFAASQGDRLLNPNGRGIMIARELSFDDVSFLGRGNVVKARVALEDWQEL